MKLLVATKETQKQRRNDYCWVPEGEPVGFGFGFAHDGEEIDGTCGCRRAMCGVYCNQATTTMKVVDSKITKKQLVALRKKHYQKDWFFSLKTSTKMALQEVADLQQAVYPFPVGCIVEKRGEQFVQRIPTSP